MPAEQHHVALDASIIVENGDWIRVDSLFSIIFTGLVADTVQVWVSNTPDKKAGVDLASIRSIQIGANITTNTSFVMDDKVVWVQVRHTVSGGAAVYADLFKYEWSGG